jgi:hypothetical protein
MPDQNAKTSGSFNWIFAAVVIGFATGCAIAIAIQSFAREPFSIDAVECISQGFVTKHAVAVAFGVTIQGTQLRSAISGVFVCAYRLIQGAKLASWTKGYCSRWLA